MADIDQLLLWFTDVNNFHLADPLLHLSLNFVVNWVQVLAAGAKDLVKWMQVTLVPQGWPSHVLDEQEHCAAGRQIHRSHTGQTQTVPFDSEVLTVICAIDLHYRINEYQVHSTHHADNNRHILTWQRLNIFAADTLVQSVSFLTQSAQTWSFWEFWSQLLWIPFHQ